MVFAASFKKKKTVIWNRVRVNKSYQRYHASCTDEVEEVLSPASVVGAGAGSPSAAMIAVHDTQAAVGEVGNPADVVDAAVVHDGGATIVAGEAVNPAEVVDAAAGAPSNSTVALIDGGAHTATEAKGEAVPVHDGGAPTAAGEAVNLAEVVNAAAGAPPNSTVARLHGGAPTAAEAK